MVVVFQSHLCSILNELEENEVETGGGRCVDKFLFLKLGAWKGFNCDAWICVCEREAELGGETFSAMGDFGRRRADHAEQAGRLA